MNKKQQIKLIKDTWQRLDYALSSIRWGGYGKEYLDLNIREEKDHNRYRPDHCKRGLTILEASKLFAVKEIVEALVGQEKDRPEIKDYLHFRKSVFYAWSLVENHREELTKALEGVNYNDILALDYVELIEE